MNVNSIANLFNLLLILLTSIARVHIVWELQIWGGVCSHQDESGSEGDG